MLCNGFLMNIWQIEMERSPYSNTLLFNRNTKLSLSIGLLLLFPALVQGADSLYDQQILQARQGQYAPFLSYLQQYQLRHALTPSQVADWLQVALWAGQDDEVVKVWRRYQVYMPLPARGTAAAAQALRNQKQWQTSLTLWQQALSQPWQRRLSYRLYQNARRCPQGRRGAQRSSSPGGGAGERCAPADALLCLPAAGQKLGPAVGGHADPRS